MFMKSRYPALFCFAFLILFSAACSEQETLAPNPGSDASEPSDLTDSSDPATGSSEPSDTADPAQPEPEIPDEAELVLMFDANFPPVVRERITAMLTQASQWPIVQADTACPVAMHPDSRVLSFGETEAALISEVQLADLAVEGFIVEAGTACGVPGLGAGGKALNNEVEFNIGMLYGSFALLEELGFAFWHPLEQLIPPTLPTDFGSVSLREEPYWPIRGFQIHTMHPTDLANVLNGWGYTSKDDEAGFEAMRSDWDKVLLWMVANRQNHVHWVLLSAEAWEEWAYSQERLDRLTKLVDQAHSYGLRVGVDVPIALEQQHAFRLIPEQGELADEITAMRERIDYLMSAGFDYLASESGTSEFTHPEPSRMLAWMDELASYLDEAYKSVAYMKIHISSGQVAEGYPDPVTGEDINFNFLTYHADQRLGILPHTVQHYALDDPAPTYGNNGFSHMRDYLQQEAGRRPTVWHPETAYWVSFDIDVPLFLPIYAHRRLHDLRLLAQDEISGNMAMDGARMDGQMVFSSGWEWGYWLNDAVSARAVWNPRIEMATDEDAMADILQRMFKPFGGATAAVTSHLQTVMQNQMELLIEGRVNGQVPDDVNRRNGQAYMSGMDTWDDVADVAGSIPGVPAFAHQPDKLGLVDMRNPLHDPPGYSAEVDPLLTAMEDQFGEDLEVMRALESQIPTHVLPYYDELMDGLEINALRATQVHGLYDYVDGYWDTPEEERMLRMNTARAALDDGLALVAERESHYRLDPERVASWTPNPTAYDYRFMWTTRTLYYWWRDEGKAWLAPVSPCYMNHINPFAVAFGEGLYVQLGELANLVLDGVPGVGSLAECFVAPASEPIMPPDGLR